MFESVETCITLIPVGILDAGARKLRSRKFSQLKMATENTEISEHRIQGILCALGVLCGNTIFGIPDFAVFLADAESWPSEGFCVTKLTKLEGGGSCVSLGPLTSYSMPDRRRKRGFCFVKKVFIKNGSVNQGSFVEGGESFSVHHSPSPAPPKLPQEARRHHAKG
ncbi:hypothetical protein Pla144_42610 [Bythopirellula polymerisocia]|uniref:Uncharacterized protein n=1 Tax=Bythopirellula polymerisocia TaxID=2528003 RepID=A0A5C6CDX5_9BACT|nr:hypothetical protein Pla144_42610 [Bythopirellula polymerisocia]